MKAGQLTPRVTADGRSDAAMSSAGHVISARPAIDDAYLSLRALVTYSGLNVRTLRTYLTSRVHPLPCYRVGVKILVRRSEFDAWMQQFRDEPNAVNIDAVVDDIVNGLR